MAAFIEEINFYQSCIYICLDENVLNIFIYILHTCYQ